MSAARRIRNVAASVRQRLLNLSRQQGLDFNLVLQRYAAERFLYRLSVSDEVDRFTLKGAALFRVWDAEDLRPTRDVDFLAFRNEDHDSLRATLGEICAMPCPEDGVVFDASTIRIWNIREDQPNGGMRVRMEGLLERARLHLQMDIGFGDVITPEREERDYPTLLDLPAPRLWTYPRETLVAEKFDAMVSRGMTNTRVKDLWDIACIARRFAFDGETLRTAVEETFRQRQTPLVDERPLALRPDYYLDATRTQRWRVLQRQIDGSTDGPALLVDAGEELVRFLGPVCDSLIDGRTFTQAWSAGGPWRPRTGVPGGGEEP